MKMFKYGLLVLVSCFNPVIPIMFSCLVC